MTDQADNDALLQEDRSRLAKGASLAFLGRVGALAEAASFPLFLWLYGPVIFGVYATLWALLRIGSGITTMGMDAALQRFLPAFDDETDIHRGLAVALAVSMLAGLAGTALLIALAPQAAVFLDGSEAGDAAAPIIRVYAWLLPLWTLMEMATASVRARLKFGPEIRIRAFFEPVARIGFAVLFAWSGMDMFGLFLSHICSMAVAAVLATRLMGRFYRLGRLWSAGADMSLAGEMIRFALPMMPATLILRLFSELPVILLNAVLPGAAGAAAAGYYSIARKLSSVLMIIYNSFDYAIAPLAAYRAGRAGKAAVADMYAYSARLMIGLGIVIAGGTLAFSDALVAQIDSGATAALVAMQVLILGRLGTFFFGHAAAMVRTVSSSLLSLANGVIGMAVMLALFFPLAEADGAVGAAFAAAAGLIVSRGLAAIEIALLLKISPYSRLMLRPLVVSLLIAAGNLAIGQASGHLHPGVQAPLFVILLLLSLACLVRYGYGQGDAQALGAVGRLLRAGRAA